MSSSGPSNSESFDSYYSEVSKFLAKHFAVNFVHDLFVKNLGKKNWRARLGFDAITADKSIAQTWQYLFQFESVWSAANWARITRGSN